MIFENMIGKDFENLSKRLIYNHAIQMAPLRIVGDIGEESQKQLYAFVCNFYKTVYNDSSIIGMDNSLPDECEDKAFNKGYLDTRKLMRSETKKIDNVFDWLVLCGNIGTIISDGFSVNKKESKLNKTKLNILNNIGISSVVNNDTIILSCADYPLIWAALQYISQTNKYLAQCVFDTDYIYQHQIYAGLCETPDEVYRMVEFTSKNGFALYREYKGELKYDASKTICGIPFMFKCAYDVRKYYQISFTFFYGKDAFYGLHTIFAKLPQRLQDFVYSISHECNGCGSCTFAGTKKTFAYFTVNYNGNDVNLCHTYQGLSHRKMDSEFVDNIIALYEFINASIK